MSNDTVLRTVLDQGGFNGADLIARANEPAVKAKLRAATAEAKEMGLCGVPTYRVLRQGDKGKWEAVGGLVWGQDEINVVGFEIVSTVISNPQQDAMTWSNLQLCSSGEDQIIVLMYHDS